MFALTRDVDAGGLVALLALNGLFLLMTKHGLSARCRSDVE